MRILFWLAALMSFLGYSFALALLLGLQNTMKGGEEIAQLFLPLLGFGILLGLVANLIRRFKPDELGKNENAAGIILSMMTGIGAIVIILNYLGIL